MVIPETIKMELLEKLKERLWERASTYMTPAQINKPSFLKTRNFTKEEAAIYRYGYYVGKSHGYEEAAECAESLIDRAEVEEEAQKTDI